MVEESRSLPHLHEDSARRCHICTTTGSDLAHGSLSPHSDELRVSPGCATDAVLTSHASRLGLPAGLGEPAGWDDVNSSAPTAPPKHFTPYGKWSGRAHGLTGSASSLQRSEENGDRGRESAGTFEWGCCTGHGREWARGHGDTEMAHRQGAPAYSARVARSVM